MTMRIIPILLSTLFVAALQAPPAAADEASEVAALKAAMRGLDEAFHNQDGAMIRSMMTPDHRAVTFYYAGPQTVDEQIASLSDLKVEYYDFTEPEIALLGAGAALATYEHSYRGTFMGNPVPDRVFVSAIWVASDGTWRERFYQETVIAAK